MYDGVSMYFLYLYVISEREEMIDSRIQCCAYVIISLKLLGQEESLIRKKINKIIIQKIIMIYRHSI